MRIIVIGSGDTGTRYIAALSALGHDISVVDTRNDASNAPGWATLREKFPNVSNVVPTFSDALHAKFDAIPCACIIATPAVSRIALMQQAVNAGYHVIVEQPFFNSSVRYSINQYIIQKILATARDKALVCMVSNPFRFDPKMDTLRKAIDDADDIYSAYSYLATSEGVPIARWFMYQLGYMRSLLGELKQGEENKEFFTHSPVEYAAAFEAEESTAFIHTHTASPQKQHTVVINTNIGQATLMDDGNTDEAFAHMVLHFIDCIEKGVMCKTPLSDSLSLMKFICQ